MEKVTRKIHIPLTPTMFAKLQAQAEREGRKFTAMARYAIEQYLRSRQRPAREEDTRDDPHNV